MFAAYLMEGKCLITTSRAWMVSNGTLGSRPERASCKACKLTQDIHLIATLNILSLPSPGSVTSSSTCNNAKQQTKMILSIERENWEGLRGDHAEKCCKTWEKTKSNDECISYSLFLQLDFSEYISQKTGRLPSCHLSPSETKLYFGSVCVQTGRSPWRSDNPISDTQHKLMQQHARQLLHAQNKTWSATTCQDSHSSGTNPYTGDISMWETGTFLRCVRPYFEFYIPNQTTLSWITLAMGYLVPLFSRL